MPDWLYFVQTQLGNTGLPREREQEIVEELAGHLEDAARNDDPEPGPDWAALGRHIQNAEENSMRSRLRTIWIPGLITGIVSAYLLHFLQTSGMRPHIIWGAMPVVIYVRWLVMLPLVGALGAFCSRYAGGSRRERLVAATLPCTGMLVLFCLGSLLAMTGRLFTEGVPGAIFIAQATLEHIAAWFVAPAAGLALGALPLLWGGKPAAVPDRGAAVQQ